MPTTAEIIASIAAKDPRYASLVPGAVIPQVRPSPATDPYPCSGRGSDVLREEECKSCGGRVRLKVYSCSLGHGECTIGRKAPGVAGCCRTCPDRTKAPSPAARKSPAPRSVAGNFRLPDRGNRPLDTRPITRRHCLMHVHPVSGNGVWQRAVAQLAARRELFGGKIVIAVTTGAALDPPDAVARLAPWATVIPVKNNPPLREVATWAPLWDHLTPHLDSTDAVLYCHAKGVTRNVDPGNSCQWWGSLLWSLALDHWPVVAARLAEYPIAGSFLKVGAGFAGSASAFHYSGTFFWLRADDFLARRRRVEPPRRWWGVEAWPGVAYNLSEAGCVFHAGAVPTLDLYSPGYWSTTLRPEYEAWLRANPPSWEWTTAPVTPP